MVGNQTQAYCLFFSFFFTVKPGNNNALQFITKDKSNAIS